MHKTCEQCGDEYPRHRKFSKAQWEASRFCGQECMGSAFSEQNAKDRPSIEDKFNSMFTKADGCWEWQGTIDGYGYGVLDHNYRRYRAHVLALQYDGRPVPKGMMACHHCDNPRCVNPAHLYPGSAQDNSDDAVARERLPVGEGSPQAKLSENQVREIRSMNGKSYAEIARAYGVSRPTVTRIINGETWRHVI